MKVYGEKVRFCRRENARKFSQHDKFIKFVKKVRKDLRGGLITSQETDEIIRVNYLRMKAFEVVQEVEYVRL